MIAQHSEQPTGKHRCAEQDLCHTDTSNLCMDLQVVVKERQRRFSGSSSGPQACIKWKMG